MQTDLNRLKRRPFLVPLLLPVALIALSAAMAIWLFDARATSMIIVVSNAETEQGVAPDSGLNEAGLARAKRLLQFLTQAKPGRGIDVVYVSEGIATQQTAAPLASSMGLAVNVVSNVTWDRLQHIISRDHSGEMILVVATHDSLKAFITQTGAGDVTLDDQDASSVFIISCSRLSKPAMVRLKY